MIRAFSERLMPPYSGQVQVAQSDTYRALTIDAQIWEIQYVKRTHVRVATLKATDIQSNAAKSEILQLEKVDEELVALLDFLAEASLPFPATDQYEYWLLDAADNLPLALIFSCSDPAQIEKFPNRAEWTALPDAVMPVERSQLEVANQLPPVNYRVERMVAERAGSRRQAQWFNRADPDLPDFPDLMIREDWSDDTQQELCDRYIRRQAPRLLMLHGLSDDDRQRLEGYCVPHAMEVARFFTLYPQILDTGQIQSLRVEAQLRAATGAADQTRVQGRRDGILYI